MDAGHQSFFFAPAEQGRQQRWVRVCVCVGVCTCVCVFPLNSAPEGQPNQEGIAMYLVACIKLGVS